MSDALDLFDDVDNNDELHVDLGTHAPRFGTRIPNPGDDVLGQVIIHNEREDALTLLNDSAAEPNFGVGTPDGNAPEFGTDENDFGVSDNEDDQPFVMPEPLYEDGRLTVGQADSLDALDEDGDDPAEKKELEGMANAVFRDLDMVLDDDSDYGDDEPGETQIRGAVDEVDTGDDALTLLDDSAAEPNFGGPSPEFGTHAPQYGVSDSEDDQPFVMPTALEDEGSFFIGSSTEQQDGEDIDPELDGIANAVFRDLDMVLDDDSDYGDDEPGETQIRGDENVEIIGSNLLAIAIAAQEAGLEPLQPSPQVYEQGLAEYTTERISASRPIIYHGPEKMKLRDWQLDFGGFAPAGTIMNVYATPQVLFQGENVVATDSFGGTATRVMMISVGQRSQRMNGRTGTLTTFYAQNALGNGALWDTCQPALTIAVTVSFIQDCTFDMTVFGKCAL